MLYTLEVVLKEFVGKLEFGLPAVHPDCQLDMLDADLPCTLVVEEPVCPFFILFCDCLGLLMPLEPSLVLLVESPTLLF